MRRTAREVAFKLIYEEMFNSERDVELSFDLAVEKGEEGKAALDIEDEVYVKQIVCLFEANKQQIDQVIKENAFGYEPERLFKVDMALLQLALTEIYHYKTSPQVVVNEVVEIAKKYSTEKSAKFINGILGAVLKNNPV